MSIITLNTKNKTSGTNSRPNFKFSEPLRHIKAFKLQSIAIRNAWYTIMSSINDKIYFDVGCTPYTATLTEGVYNSTTLAAEVESAMDTIYLVDNLFSVSESTLTYKYTITHATTNFSLEFATNTTASAAKTLGYNNTDTAAATSHVANNIFNLNYSENINIHSNDLSHKHSRRSLTRTDLYFSFPIESDFAGLTTYKNNGDDHIVTFRNNDFNEIGFVLRFDDGVEAPMNGLDWSITMLMIEDKINSTHYKHDGELSKFIIT